jgi:hypothetical protein
MASLSIGSGTELGHAAAVQYHADADSGDCGDLPGDERQAIDCAFPGPAVFELLGPIAAQWGLQRAGESHPET